MKPTTKVSIGGLAFTLEEDAYLILNNYLQSLKKHFANNTESEEIIADIEFRLSELLQMRLNSTDDVVTVNEASEIIKIMGNPKDFDDSINITDDSSTTSSLDNTFVNNEKNPDFEKKLYRDLDNKVIGGVCSGIGHYFKIDPTAIRLIFLGLFLLLFFAWHHAPSSLTIIGLYVLLWIIMPAARTFKQKIAMTGDDPSITNIEERNQATVRKYKGSSINKVLGTLLNIVVGFVAVITFLFLISFIAVFVYFYFDTDILGISNYLILLGYDTWNFKISVFIACIFPILGFFILMVKILRRTSFNSGTFISFMICFILWLGTVFYLGNKGFKFAYSHQDSKEIVEHISSDTITDTLYVKLGQEYTGNQFLPHNPNLIYRGDKIKDREISILPRVKVIDADSLSSDYKIEIQKMAYGRDRMSAKRNAEDLKFDYTLSESVLTLNPAWYNNEKHWNMEMFVIVIYKPQGKTVIVENDLNKYYYHHPMNIGYHY